MMKKEFKAESKRLLDLMINSIYTHKEIFLREIISNASDAIDKLCYLSLTDDKVGIKRDEFEIKLILDKENRLLTVSDNGIGMSQEELENNLGVIASSGSLKFRQQVEGDESADTDIIGQFGVGFYSAFMVADEITVITRKYGEEQGWKWQSSGVEGYTVEPCDKETVGTDVIMHIKPDTEEEKDEYSQYLREYPLYKLVKKYSDYIRFPIRMRMPHPKLKEGCPEDKPEYEEVFEWETLNSMVPLWQRKKTDVTQEEYNEFYQQRFADTEPPRHYRIRRGRGDVQGAAVHPGEGAAALLLRGVRGWAAAVFRRRDDHGQVQGAAAGVLQLRPGRGGIPRSEPEHLPRAFAA